jgi:hypothetical protein
VDFSKKIIPSGELLGITDRMLWPSGSHVLKSISLNISTALTSYNKKIDIKRSML